VVFCSRFFIELLVNRVRSLNVGCHISTVCCSIFIYANDILLIEPTVSGLQVILATCERELINIDMCINISKSKCINFGAVCRLSFHFWL